MKKKLFFAIFLFSSLLKADLCVNNSGFDYSKAKTFKEEEPNNNFLQAVKNIIPVPYPIKSIKGTIKKKDTDYYLVYLTRPSKIRLEYSGYSGFFPGIVIYNKYKQYLSIKTYASATKEEFGVQKITLKILKPDFYFIKIANISGTQGIYPYRLEIVPLDLSLYPNVNRQCNKMTINNLRQQTLHELFYKDIINKFKTMEEYKKFR